MQLDVRERGFAYAEDAPLDMRMDGTTGPTAADVLNTYSAKELTRVLREYGEERFASKIAAAVVRQREQSPFTTSARLVELLYAEIPAPARRTGGHPAKRTFQALRIEVNDELAVLRRAVPAAIDAIRVGGRVVVESYHSLEDRLVKQAFTAVTRSVAPPDLPVVPEELQPAFRLVTRGAERADADEIAANPRAASVRLRAVERVKAERRSRSMSTPALQLRERLPAARPTTRCARARLTVVPRRRVRAARMPFVTLVSLVLLGGVVGLLCFNTQMQQASFAATSLETQSNNLAAREQTLHDELQNLRDPQDLAAPGPAGRDGHPAELLHASGSPRRRPRTTARRPPPTTPRPCWPARRRSRRCSTPPRSSSPSRRSPAAETGNHGGRGGHNGQHDTARG